MSAKHEFAFYFIGSNTWRTSQTILIDDKTLVNRLINVVRLMPGEHFVLFNDAAHAQCVLLETGKKNIKVQIITVASNAPLKPYVELLLPLLKREDFELALYAAVELGVTKIQLIETQKAQRSWGGQKDAERAQRIMIAAAEQSKNYLLPGITGPVSLQNAIEGLTKTDVAKVFFDPSGQQLLDVLQVAQAQNSQHIVLMVGPEGDLVPQEKTFLKDHRFIFCALTPTVLRSIQAIQVGVGAFRSVFSR